MVDAGTIVNVITGILGIGAASVVGKAVLQKLLTGKNLETVEFAARTDIIQDLRTGVKQLQERLLVLEERVAKLSDRLIEARTHALIAYNVVYMKFEDTPARAEALDAISKILKED